MSWITLLWLLCTYADSIGSSDLVDLIPEGSNNGAKSLQKVDDDKKTLSQQVAEGRYALIPKEIFKNPVVRPGVISYESNSEVPTDNVNNLGGLNESDIWLAEKHLLVLKGGVLSLIENEYDGTNPEWEPIDDYKAPKRPVKIPNNPKVPPPFPVQLTEGGPIQILGTNFTRTINESFYPAEYPLSPVDGYDSGTPPFFGPPYQYPSNITSGQAPFPDSPFITPLPGVNQTGYDVPPAFPIGNGIPPFFDQLPPGSAVLPPPNNTDEYDEDDLSIYYPPPYSFHYDKDNTSKVPAGPLVPGIVLPPPPNFFSLLNPTRKPQTTTQKPAITRNTTTIPTPVYIKPTTPTLFTSKTPQRNKTLSVTILRPVKTTKKPSITYVHDNQVPNKPFEVYGPPPPSRQYPKVTIKTTKVPLKPYYSTSRETDTNLVTLLNKNRYTTKPSLRKPKPPPPPQIYYYDESPVTNLVKPYQPEQKILIRNLSDYYMETNEQKVITNPRYYLPSHQYSKNPQPNHFQNHLTQLQDQIDSFQRTRTRTNAQTAKPVYQYSFEVANYKEQHERLNPIYQPQYKSKPQYTVEIEPAIELTTQRSIYQNRPIPVYIQTFSNNEQQYNYQEPKYATTNPNVNAYTVTPNPIYEPYYTKQDDQGLDDMTKSYFTTFGKRIRSSTTPVPPSKIGRVVFPQGQQSRKVQPKRPSEDVLVSYLKRPLETDAPYVEEYPQSVKQVPQYLGTYQSPILPEENYRQKDIETIQAINVPVRTSIREGHGGSFISYELPGDNGAHFYFLTPQLSNYYPQSSGQRIRQNRATKVVE